MFCHQDNYILSVIFCWSLLSGKLTTASKEVLASHTSPSCSPNSIQGSRRGSISSISSVSSVLDEKDDDRIRCCRHCKDTLLKREQQIDEREHIPDIVKLYEVKWLRWRLILDLLSIAYIIIFMRVTLRD